MIPRRTFLAMTAGAALARGADVRERYVAIDNVCAWPKIARLPDGSLAVAVYNQPAHGRLMGDVECWVSRDGRFWRHAGTPARHTPGTARLNHAIGTARNGDLLVIAAGWLLSKDKPDAEFLVKRKLLPCWVCRSPDGGRTWTVSEEFPAGPDGYTLVPFGNVTAGADGALRVSAYVYRPDRNPRTDTCCVLRSGDDGRTWRIFGTIGDRVHNECDIAHVGGGRWLAIARTRSGCDVLASEDDAATWRPTGFSTQANEHPGDLCVLQDGRIAMTYGSRRSEWMGVAARLSRDGGRTWGNPIRLADVTSSDAGYPASAQLADGPVVTVYYAKSSAGHARYHMGAVIWSTGE